MADNGFKSGYANALRDHDGGQATGCGIKATPHITSRLKTLKRLWQTAYDIIYGPNTSGFGWDPETKLVTSDEDVWDEYLKEQFERRLSVTAHYSVLHCHTYATSMNDRCFPMLGQPFSHFVFTNPIVDLSNFEALTSNLGHWTSSSPHFPLFFISNPKQVPKGKPRTRIGNPSDPPRFHLHVEAFVKHGATLRRGGRGGRFKDTTNDPNAYDEYAKRKVEKRG
ncbi:hypothetical protein K1719_015481 [Acacia pycnantha]|nr:hypothetical protein K1719_015481 [Acacia pycnantha]